MEIVNENEKNEERKQRMLTELGTMITGAPLSSLDSKSREMFSTRFNAFKGFLYEFNS
jgi:hypothetical protein